MLFSVFPILALGVGSVLGAPFQNATTGMNCGSQPSSEWITAAEADFKARQATHKRDVGASAATLNVFWHVISSDTSSTGGNIPDSQIASSIAVLNANFWSSGLSFRIAGVDRTLNPVWFNNASPGNLQQTTMKTALRRGGVADLNIYSVGRITGAEALGYATFPFDYNSAPRDDGIVLRYDTVPGGSLSGFNTGKNLVHQTGHWVGLFHTFQGGCNAPGDCVDDTPYEASPASGCPTGRDTCPGAGLDPINNHMDSTDDACRTWFTAGQISRFRAQMAQYRGVRI